MKILRVISSVDLKNGGPINGLVNSSELLIKGGHSVDVACLDDPSSEFIERFEYNVFPFKSCLGTYSLSFGFKKWLDLNVSNYDVVIVHGLWQWHSFAAAAACLKAGIPYVVFTHGMLDPWFNTNNRLKATKKHIYWLFLEQRVVNSASAVLFTSDEERLLARLPFKPYRPHEVVVSYGCPKARKSKRALIDIFYSAYPDLIGTKFGLFLSRIHEKKGIDLLIEALSNAVNKKADFLIAIAGPDNPRLQSKLKARISELGLDHNVLWLGMLQGDLKWGAYHASDFFILPSHQENFGIVVAEALSTGTPVLITNKVNIWREVLDSNAGLVDSDTVAGVSALLESWIALSDQEKESISLASFKCYEKFFSIEAAAKSLETVLLKVARG